jgi:hypothetical protein
VPLRVTFGREYVRAPSNVTALSVAVVPVG